MIPKYSKLISSSSLYRAGLSALDKDIQRMEAEMKANPFVATTENLDVKRLELEEKKIMHEKEMMDAKQSTEFQKINNNVEKE